MNLDEQIKKKEKELNKLKTLREKFSSIKINNDRWDNKRHYTKEANELVTDVDIHKSCGCCSEAVVMARPYLEIGDMKIHSDPCYFNIGAGTYSFGDEPWEGWDNKMREHKIPESIIQKVQEYFDKNYFPEGEED